MTYATVLAKKEFTDEKGELNKRWYPVGYVKETDFGATYLTLNMFPNTTFLITTNEKEDEIQLTD